MPGAALLRARIFHQVRSLLLVIKLNVAQFFRSALNSVRRSATAPSVHEILNGERSVPKSLSMMPFSETVRM